MYALIPVMHKGKVYEVAVDEVAMLLAGVFNKLRIRMYDGRVPYVYTNIRGKEVALHRALLGATDPNVYVDHKDGDPLNNHPSNLRTCTNTQNQGNRREVRSDCTHSLRGVTKSSPNRWKASIRIDKKKTHLGVFKSPEEAHAAYVEAHKKHFGEFSPF